jgi:hypothetical protein
MTDREVYLARAAAARADADAATLDNVRERCLRSEAAWKEMADRAERTERMRATLLSEKAAAAGSQPNHRNKNPDDTEHAQIAAQAADAGAASEN